MEGKIGRKTNDISRHGLIECFRGYSVQLSEIAVEHHAMTANEEDSLFDRSGSQEDSAGGAGPLVYRHEKKPRADLAADRHRIRARTICRTRACDGEAPGGSEQRIPPRCRAASENIRAQFVRSSEGLTSVRSEVELRSPSDHL